MVVFTIIKKENDNFTEAIASNITWLAKLRTEKTKQ
jgi:hypothetical protein